jgi:hypothetical protein
MEAGGVSWLYSTLKSSYDDRIDYLAHKVANGVPKEEYGQFCGRYREAIRLRNELQELFSEFNKAEDETGEELGDLDEQD